MANYTYLRVSADDQDVANQRHGILEYCNKNSLTALTFIEGWAHAFRAFMPSGTRGIIAVMRVVYPRALVPKKRGRP